MRNSLIARGSWCATWRSRNGAPLFRTAVPKSLLIRGVLCAILHLPAAVHAQTIPYFDENGLNIYSAHIPKASPCKIEQLEKLIPTGSNVHPSVLDYRSDPDGRLQVLIGLPASRAEQEDSPHPIGMQAFYYTVVSNSSVSFRPIGNHVAMARISPDGRKCAYIAYDEDWRDTLCIDNLEDTRHISIRPYVSNFAWFPDSNRLAIAKRSPPSVAFPANKPHPEIDSLDDMVSRLYVASSDNQQEAMLFPQEVAEETSPLVSRSGQFILFGSSGRSPRDGYTPYWSVHLNEPQATAVPLYPSGYTVEAAYSWPLLCSCATWNLDGTKLALSFPIAANDDDIWTLSFSSAGKLEALRSRGHGRFLGFSSANTLLIQHSLSDERSDLEVLSIAK